MWIFALTCENWGVYRGVYWDVTVPALCITNILHFPAEHQRAECYRFSLLFFYNMPHNTEPLLSNYLIFHCLVHFERSLKRIGCWRNLKSTASPRMILWELIMAHEMLTDYGFQCYRNNCKGKTHTKGMLLWRAKKKKWDLPVITVSFVEAFIYSVLNEVGIQRRKGIYHHLNKVYFIEWMHRHNEFQAGK